MEARKEEEAKLIAAANAVVEKLKKTSVTIPAKVGSGDKLFGSINNADLSAALEKAGVAVEKKYIKIPGNTIKRTGKVTANIRLHRNVEYNFEFDIVSDAPVEAQKPAAAPKAKTEETPAEEA